MKEYTVRENSTLKAFTDATCPQASMCLRTLLKNREVRVNGVKVGADCPLKKGDVVAYYMTKAQEGRRAYSIVYEDENVLVIDKESGVSSEAIFAELSGHSDQMEESPDTQRVYFIHRLDRNTEGLMIFARTAEANEELLACFRERRTQKVYHALVFGTMPKLHDTLTARLVKDGNSARVYVRPYESSRGEVIVTEYEVLEARGETSLVKVTLHTGKTHQIRAHLAYIGHPVVGDEKYGDSARNKSFHATRQRLLSKVLTLQTKGVLAYLNGKTFTSEKNI